jgi:carbon-monoxide dehydrogenase medium subunit
VRARAFEYAAPTALQEVLELQATFGSDSTLLAGGQTLVPLLAAGLVQPSLLVDLNRVTELAFLRPADDGGLAVGPLTRIRALEVSPLVAARWPLARAAAPFIGTRQIRNRGTVGGSIASADPLAELPAVALATGARIVVRGTEGLRTLPAGAFFQSDTPALAPEETVTEIQVPPLAAGTGSAFLEVNGRTPGTLIAVAASVRLNEAVCEDAKIVVIGAGSAPVEIPALAILRGEPMTERAAVAAGSLAARLFEEGSYEPATVEYRRQAAAILTRRALLGATASVS